MGRHYVLEMYPLILISHLEVGIEVVDIVPVVPVVLDTIELTSLLAIFHLVQELSVFGQDARFVSE